jgi:uncharacterized protein YbaP (TraB family)
MKTASLALFSLVLTAIVFPFQGATAQKSAATTTRQPLWKIEGKRATVYLLGSVHFLKKEHYPVAAPIEEAFERAKIAVFETDIEAIEKPEIQMALLSKSALPPGQTLRDQLSPKLYERLAAQLAETGLPVDAVKNLKPGMVAMTMTLIEMQKLGLDPKLGLDRHFHGRARTAGKEVIALEEPQFQVDMITGFSKEEGEAILDSTLKDIQTLKTLLGKLLTSWQTGDMKALAGLLNQALEGHPALYQRLLVDRNKRWVPRIEELMRGDKDAIVIVGAGHLAGKQSVIEMLEKNGAKVVQQ